MLDFSAPWQSLPIAVIDFETTGPDPDVDVPVQIGIVRFEGGEIVERFGSLVNPETMQISEGAQKIHGITQADADAAPTLITLLANATGLLRDAVPCAYNAPFDRTILHRFYTSTIIPAMDRTVAWLDPLVIIRDMDRYVKGPGRHKLEATCRRHGVATGTMHDAVGDCEATGALLWSLRERLGDVPLGELLKRLTGRRRVQEQDYQTWLAKQPQKETT